MRIAVRLKLLAPFVGGAPWARTAAEAKARYLNHLQHSLSASKDEHAPYVRIRPHLAAAAILLDQSEFHGGFRCKGKALCMRVVVGASTLHSRAAGKETGHAS